MKSSLVEFTSDLQRKQHLEIWFNEFLPDEELLDYLNQDSWRLYEAVWYLFGKRPRPEIEDPYKIRKFLFSCRELSESLAETSESQVANDKTRIIFEAITRLCIVYDKAVRAIEGYVLAANAEMVIRDSYSFTRYHVKPKEFLLWAHNRNLLRLPKVERLLTEHVLPKRPGRNRNETKDKRMASLAELSNRPEHKNKLTAGDILELDEAQLTLEKLLQGHKGKARKDKLDRITRDLREHPEFGGLKMNTGPKHKKGNKS